MFKQRDIQKDQKSMINRLRSIKHDAKFVEFCCLKFPQFPVVPNERAGSWYVSPKLRSHGKTVYFKSTDGHYDKWDFSLKRTNLHILSTIQKSGGIIFVDVTRKGKRFPDSLATTIPIWCSVLNTVAYNFKLQQNINVSSCDISFNCPSTVISETERHKIQQLIPVLVDKLTKTNINIREISDKIRKPLKPIWIHPGSRFFTNDSRSHWEDDEIGQLGFIPIICVSASISISQVEENNIFEPIFKPDTSFDYIQGGADDSETWAPGFTSSHFWMIEDFIKDNISNSELEEKVNSVIKSGPVQSETRIPFEWISDYQIAIGNRRAAEPPQCWNHFDVIVNCGSPKYDYEEHQCCLYLEIPEGKKGQQQFFDSLDPFLCWIHPHLHKRILIHCMQGIDRSGGIALALLQRFSRNGKLDPDCPFKHCIKTDIMNKLLEIQAYRPIVSPTRATMKKLNLYFVEKSEI